ncbi:DNA polymerase III, delta subunit [Flavobacterium limnosediminis JC2902]|uniref:DNA polymerase III subunit delta n=1 Tax=Flavobacterium limnosediminis JC2902 TaxID=1341181 RepID=V6SLN2_9FLAO|nr:DNA polymerase III subunit delta [Flavobacterium limnosediminis]ESU25305.1 DNA polymerase III, delta subunit [Flavobacterium limnosediminis JC2902]
MDEVLRIIKEIQAGNIKPIYFLMGEEPYYIDKLAEYIEQNILQEHERDFNQTVLYGRDVTIEDVVGNAKRFPMMADRQVVIVKEAQELARTIEKLDAYAENPQPTTVLVICYKYKTLDKRKKVTKTLAKHGVVFESKKLYENQVGDWMKRVLAGKKLNIEPKAVAMFVDFLGTDLSRIANEIDKLAIILKPGETITPAIIEENIGFSKDFNPFELRKAIGERNQLKAYQIADYFAQNPKDNPIVLTVGLVFGFFSQLLQYHGLKDKSPSNVAKVIKVNPYFLKDYDVALKNYPMKKVSAIVSTLRDIDVKSKGVGANNMPQHDLLKEMLVKIFN